MILPRDQQKKLADDRLLRSWKAWHQEQLDEALAGEHGAVIEPILSLLDRMELTPNSAAALITGFQSVDWSAVSSDVRATLLHQAAHSIARQRERNGLPPLDDPLSDQQPDNVYRRVKAILFAPSPPPGGHQSVPAATSQRPPQRVSKTHE